MADAVTKKLSALTAKTSITKNDEVVVIDRDISATPSSKRVTVKQILKKARIEAATMAV